MKSRPKAHVAHLVVDTGSDSLGRHSVDLAQAHQSLQRVRCPLRLRLGRVDHVGQLHDLLVVLLGDLDQLDLDKWQLPGPHGRIFGLGESPSPPPKELEREKVRDIINSNLTDPAAAQDEYLLLSNMPLGGTLSETNR